MIPPMRRHGLRPGASVAPTLLGRTFVLSLAVHGAVLGALAAVRGPGGGAPPPPTTIRAEVPAGLPLEQSRPLDPSLPVEGPPPAESEFLLDALPVEPDPRFVADPAAKDAYCPVIGIPAPGGRPLPRVRRPGGGTGGGAGGGTAETAPPAPGPAPEPVPSPAVVLTVARPAPGECPPPGYPEGERERGVQGSVRLRVGVAADGSVASVEVAVTSGSAALDEAALECVRGWRFLPATADGTPVASVVLQPVTFRLR